MEFFELADVFLKAMKGLYALARSCWRAIAGALVMGGLGYMIGGVSGFAIAAVPGALVGAYLGAARDPSARKSVGTETILDALMSLVIIAGGYAVAVYGSMLIAGLVVAAVIAIAFALSALV
jgi:hypothetical protein